MSSSDPDVEWLQSAPCEGLLETDIRSRSFNKAKFVVDEDGRERRVLPWKSSKLILDNVSPLDKLRIDDTRPMYGINERSVCPQCNSSRKYFCYTCYVPLRETEGIIPRVEALPIRVDVIKHARECDGKVRRIDCCWSHKKKQ